MTIPRATRQSSPQTAHARAEWMEMVATLEPTLRVDGAGAASFQLDGRRIGLVLEPDGWLIGWTPLRGAADRWRTWAGDVGALAKVVDGPALRVDVPLAASRAGGLGDAFDLLRAALHDALGLLVGGEAAPCRPARSSPVDADLGAAGKLAGPPSTAALASEANASGEAAMEILRTYAMSSPWLYSSDEHGSTLVVETARGRQQRITARITAERLCLTAPLGPEPREPASRRAVAHFLGAIDERVRLVRGVVDEQACGSRLFCRPSVSTWICSTGPSGS